jgi:hypothetical protein
MKNYAEYWKIEYCMEFTTKLLGIFKSPLAFVNVVGSK